LGSLDVGINLDEAAVESPTLLRDCLVDSFHELALIGQRSSDAGPSDSSDAPRSRRRWWFRSR
jgi:hypothetical protein